MWVLSSMSLRREQVPSSKRMYIIFPLTLGMRVEILAGVDLDDEGIVLKKLLNLYLPVDLLSELGMPTVVDYFFYCELFACVIDQ